MSNIASLTKLILCNKFSTHSLTLTFDDVNGSSSSTRRSRGEHKLFPNAISAGENPVDLFGVILRANKAYFNCKCYSNLFLVVFVSMGRREPWSLSTHPFDCGWYGVVLICLTPIVLASCFHHICVP